MARFRRRCSWSHCFNSAPSLVLNRRGTPSDSEARIGEHRVQKLLSRRFLLSGPFDHHGKACRKNALERLPELAHKPQTDQHPEKPRCISISPREQCREASRGSSQCGFACQSVIEGRFARSFDRCISERALLFRRLPWARLEEAHLRLPRPRLGRPLFELLLLEATALYRSAGTLKRNPRKDKWTLC